MRSCTTMPLTIADFKIIGGNSGWKKWEAQTAAKYPVLLLKIEFHSYLAENSQKPTLNFYFKSRFSVKPSKFPIYFAHDCGYLGKNWTHSLDPPYCDIRKIRNTDLQFRSPGYAWQKHEKKKEQKKNTGNC